MRTKINQPITIIALIAIWFASCKKEDVTPLPAKNNDVQFVIEALPNVAPADLTDLAVIVTVKNNVGQELVTNRKLSITYNGQYKTEKLNLPDGQYFLTRFLVTGANNLVRFAAPIAGSAKAALVQKPLSLAFGLPRTAVTQLDVQVLTVRPSDEAQAFGYPAEAFQPQPNEGTETFKVKVQAVITIGSITYDSIPARFRIRSWDANNVLHEKDTLLAAGVNTLGMPKDHIRFEFAVDKWGIMDSIRLEKDQVDAQVVYTLGGQKDARKLSKEESFLEVMNTYQPSSKALYSYNAIGLDKVEYFQKKPQFADLQFTYRHQYSYSFSTVSRIDVYDSANIAVGFTKFTYNPQGTKVTNMHQKSYDVETFAAVDYGVSIGAAEITIDYLYNNGHSMEYRMKIKGGNKVEDQALSSTGGGEGGTYAYDFNINPYAHMNMPNMFLSNLSKNNVINQQKNFGGSIPSVVVYRIEYKYDQEGYPTEVVKYYKGYQSDEHLYKIKTVYSYL